MSEVDGMTDIEHGWLLPEAIMICAACGYTAWRENYPCNRCGGLIGRKYVPEAEQPQGAVEALRERVMALGGMRRTDHGAFWIDRDDVLRLLDELGGR